MADRAVLVDRHRRRELDPEHLRLPETLVSDLREWARVIDRIGRGEKTGEAAARVISQRGSQLATRIAAEAGIEIDYRDPNSGELWKPGKSRVAPTAGPEPIPWGTGLTVSAFFAAIVVLALTVVTFGLAEVSPLLAGIVNIAVAAGFAPSIWLGRRVLVWRWVALGTAAGIVLAWMALLLSALG